jgi:oxygen-independent coproporphyrinogen-3 oxidase
MDEALITRYAAPVPRYTSYPTAPHFDDRIGEADYAGWLAALPARARLSAYVHVPFCDTLCWFCGCHTKITGRHAPVAAYLETLRREVALVAEHLDGACVVEHMHWGGGSPTILEPDEITGLAAHMRALLPAARHMEFAVEIDPRGLDAARLDALAEAGVTRASIGVQDFDPRVQAAINRVQTFAETARVVDGLRSRGVGSVNLDLMYGLPHQTAAGIARTVRQSLVLRPERIALFGYAHVPWMKTHQRLLDEAALPGLVERFEQSQSAAAVLEAAGYVRIGLDHFALRSDALAIAQANGALRRNFQGYTADGATALLGFGASAIGRLPQGYVQNETAIHAWRARIGQGRLAVARGKALTDDDAARGGIIEELMCTYGFAADEALERYGAAARPVIDEARAMAGDDADGLVRFAGGRFEITDTGRPFVRSVCARFDAYLRRAPARHSVAV